MRRPLAPVFAALALATSAQAANPPGAPAVVEALDQACSIYVLSGDYDGYIAKAESLEFKDFFGTRVRRTSGVDMFIISATADAPDKRRCTVALDGPPALAEPMPAAVAAWAKTRGFKPDGKPTQKTNDEGKPYVRTGWKAPKGSLEMNVFGVDAKGRVNVVVTWTTRD
ncbi:hypothetical protein QO010_001384 [Caulobacter ginsengisoli]|uniref:DUF3828 domain-containing protein n=1 Tax=Caulobacter ginsengisoli TaxID=400775 RepID=A0ABU0INM7_9CAUL|nr:hypothetical protein [Caulobacter ginsengisoli]MDQ0463613.1 hypothetical protein [Caulobacter ginsengisoli]